MINTIWSILLKREPKRNIHFRVLIIHRQQGKYIVIINNLKNKLNYDKKITQYINTIALLSLSGPLPKNITHW